MRIIALSSTEVTVAAVGASIVTVLGINVLSAPVGAQTTVHLTAVGN